MAIDIESFKKAGFTFEEIQDIIESEKEFEKTGE
jgi:DNA-binding transcriptional MerR regulator